MPDPLVSWSYEISATQQVWAQHLDEQVRRRFYKNWFKSKKKAFTKYAKLYEGQNKNAVRVLGPGLDALPLETLSVLIPNAPPLHIFSSSNLSLSFSVLDTKVEEQLKRIVEFADVVRVVAHTQIKLLKLRQKRAHVMEIQVRHTSA